MDIKDDILSRAYLSFFIIIGICLLIIGRAAYIQQSQGNYWRSVNESKHQRTDTVVAERGTIYSEDGKMLCTSIPQFDIYIDFAAEGLRADNGKKFYKNIDSLSLELSNLFQDHTQMEYKKILVAEYKKTTRYFSFFKNISYEQYKQLNTFHLVKLGRNTSGFIVEVKSKRKNPYGQLAFRTIGLDREKNKVGLELSFDSILKGVNGVRTVRYEGGVPVPIDESAESEAENGKDIVTTIDVLTQEITENALLNMMYTNQAHQGCAIVMETKTGKIKAIANLGLDSNTIKHKIVYDKDDYYELKNFALLKSEPGSTFKLVTLLALLDDKKINLNTLVNTENGTWNFLDRVVRDADEHHGGILTAKQAFEASSNVGMAKMAYAAYGNNPMNFINKVHQFRMDTVSGIELVGETPPEVHKPKTRGWESTTLPWMAHGYSVSVTPMQTLTLYNAIANNGKMMKPYLVSAIRNEGLTVKEFEPIVLNEKICSDSALSAAKKCLIGVCNNDGGTAKNLFKGSTYLVAGKTGTSYFADGHINYSNSIYQSSFAGFFPANNPQYTCLVIIVNKPNAAEHFGAKVAGPVFKEIADRLYTTYVKNTPSPQNQLAKKDSSNIFYSGYKDDMKYVMNRVGVKYNENIGIADEWINTSGKSSLINVSAKKMDKKTMPLLKGMNIKDAVYLCEEMGLKVSVNGKGKVNNQSIGEGSRITFGQTVNIGLN